MSVPRPTDIPRGRAQAVPEPPDERDPLTPERLVAGLEGLEHAELSEYPARFEHLLGELTEALEDEA